MCPSEGDQITSYRGWCHISVDVDGPFKDLVTQRFGPDKPRSFRPACSRFGRKISDYINTAKALAEEIGCNTCHKVNGEGKAVGPDLTYAGDHAPEHFDCSRIKDVKTVFGCHVAHFSNPEGVSPQTEMPNINTEKKDAQALAMLMMSWRRVNLPLAYVHMPKPEQSRAAADNNVAPATEKPGP